MIITRTPFRISFAGGGSDLRSFYEKHEGCVLSTGIDKFMYIIVHPSFMKNETIIKYKQMEIVTDIGSIRHPIAKQILSDYGVSGVEVASISDIPAGTGLASSSAYTVGTINAISSYVGKLKSQERIAHDACVVEIEKLGEPIGKQDQYGVSIGGLKFIKFKKNGDVIVEPLLLPNDIMNELNDNLLMFYTGGVRSASQILKEQSANVQENDKFTNLIRMTELAYEMKLALHDRDLSSFGEMLHKGWMLKKELASGISNPEIDGLYDLAINNGASGGKLLGAGGGGFFLFYCKKENQKKLRGALSNLTELKFSFDKDGTKVIYVGDKTW